MDGNDVDDQPTPIVYLTQPQRCAQLLSTFAMEHSLEITIVDVMSMYSFTDKLIMMSNSNIKKHYQMTIDSYLAVCDIMKTKSWEYNILNSILCDVGSIFL